ncbi:PH domain-containing protein [Nocardioides sp. CFH 31398]|uniref:PH domain-containing protein n=1 Tax=Nocardioides sp. CFH 31398 TaxID=2919579 RepID=UPI001F05E9CD|nr:PH domain-containing protein [Nocardioides sp. CFH 31398]MCH1866415.1 PH domain-containing protein [Nocardioides sp. CFH 31398]
MTFPTRLLNDGERVVVSTRTHVKVLLLPLLVLLVTLVGAVLLARLGTGTTEQVLDYVAWGLAAVVVLWFVVRPFLRWWTTTYTFTDRRFVARSGVIAKEGRTIPLNRISGVDFDIGILDRMLGCGTLVVSDASVEGRVELHDIPRVERVQLQVAEELHRLGERRGDDGS